MRRFAKGVLATILVIACAVLALKGSVLVLQSGSWSQTGILSNPRVGASTATLPDGRILIAGGDPGNGPTASVDFFNTDGTISAAPPMMYARSKQVSVALQDGRILVAGGVPTRGSATNTAEIFDPITNSWSSVALGMIEARSGATAAVLQDGRVLVAGGQNGTAISSTLEIFDPVANAFSAAGMMSSPRSQHAMAVLPDGRVLIVGGNNGTAPVASTSIFDPVAGTVSPGPALNIARYGHSATTLLNGVVVVIGGNNGNAVPAQMDVTPAELFDPTAGTFSTLATNLTTPREDHLAILLPNNNSVLIAGGTSAGTAVASAELFTSQESTQAVWTYGFGPTGSMTAARSGAAGSANQVSVPSTTMKRNGIVAVAGGSDANGNALNTSEAYGYPTVQTDQGDYPPGTTATITGSGFQAGEAVTIQLVESPLIDTHGPFTVQADANGNFVNTSFTTDLHDVNVRFYLTVTGGTSGFQAQNTFTDNKINVFSAPSGVTFTLQFASFNSSGNCSGTANTSGSQLIQDAGVQGNNGNVGIGNPASVQLQAPAFSDQGTAFVKWTLGDGSTQTTSTICVASPSGTYTATYGTAVPAPTLTSLSPSNADLGNANVNVILTGTNFANDATATFGGTGITLNSTTVNSTTQITANVTISTLTTTLGGQSVSVKNTVPAGFTGGGTSGSQTFTVNKRTTSTAVSCTPFSVVVSQQTGCTATVTDNDTGTAITPTGGTVTFSNANGTFSSTTCTLTGGTGSSNSCAVNYTPNTDSSSSQTINATYGGDTTHQASPTGTGTVGVSARTTTTTIAPTSASAAVGGTAQFTITVKDTSAQGTASNPAGSVTFTDTSSPANSDNITSCSLSQGANPAGTVTCTVTVTATTPTSAHTINATYLPSDNIHATSSTTTPVTLTVNNPATTTTVTSSQNPSTYGQSVTFTATVTPSSGSVNPTGMVTFTDTTTSTTLCTNVPVSNGSGDTSTATCSTSTLTVDGGAAQTITATYNATGSFTGSSGTVSGGQVVNQAAQTITVDTAAPVSATYNASFNVAAHSSSTLSVSVAGSGGCSGSGTSTGNPGSNVSITMTSGTTACTVTYSQAGNTNYSAATNVTSSTTAALATQTITVTTPAPAMAAYNNNFMVAATGGASGNPVTFSSGGACSNVGATFTMTSGTGTCTVKFDQAGNSNYSAATEVTESATAQQATQTITVTTPAPAMAAYNTNFMVAATGGASGNPVTFSSSGACSNVGATFTITSGTGTCTVKFDQAGNSNYSAATEVTESVMAQQASQATLTLNAGSPLTYSTSETLTASGGSGTGAVTFSVTSGSCSVSGTQLTANSGTGSCSVMATKAADSNYLVATASTTVALQKAGQTITVTTPAPAMAYFASQFTVAAMASSGDAVTFSFGGVCTNSGATFTMTSGTGICTVKFDQAGDTNYNAAPEVTEYVTAQRIPQTINFGALSDQTFGDPPFTVSATATSSLAVIFSSLTTGVCMTSGTNGSTVTMIAAGTCTIEADQPGDADYLPAASVTQSFNVNKAVTTATLNSSGAAVVGAPVTFTVIVKDASTGSMGTPSGTVTISDGTYAIGLVTLSTGGGSFTTTLLSSTDSPHSVNAHYNGDADFQTSDATALSQVINTRGTSTTLAFNPPQGTFEAPDTITATVAEAAGLPSPSGTPDSFTGSGNLGTARKGATATQLLSGLILVVGGQDANANIIGSAELYNPANGSTTPSGSTLVTARYDAAAALLADGRVLIVGGTGSSGVLNSAEIYNPATDSFTSTGLLQNARTGATATLLTSGKVVVIGGSVDGATPLSSNTVETFDPTGNSGVGTFGYPSTGTGLAANRFGHVAAMLASGKILIAGGNDGSTALKSAEIYDPAANTSTALTATLSVAREFAGAAEMPNNYTLIVGGDSNGSTPRGSADLYDPQAQTFYASNATLGTARTQLAAVQLNDGRMLAVGGAGSVPPSTNAALASVEAYTLAFTPQGAEALSSTGSGDTFTGTCQLQPAMPATNPAQSICTETIDPGSAGTDSVTGNYPADAVHSSSSSGATSFTVNPATTSTTVSSSSNPSIYGQSVTFTALVSNTSTGSTGIPAGSVSFAIDGGASVAGTSVSCPSGSPTYSLCATYSSASLTVSGSPHSVSVTYTNSDGNFSGSSGSLSPGQTVQKATPVFSGLTASQTITYGTPSISLVGIISAPCGTGCTVYPPNTETVSITINGVTVTPAIGSNGSFSATFSTNTIPASATPYMITYSFNANYADTNFKSATDASTTVTVNAKPITPKLIPQNRTYDGTATEPDANMSCSLTGVLSGDSANVSCAATNGTFNTSQVATANLVTATVTISGTSAGNYTLGPAGTTTSSTSATATAHITTAAVTAALTAANETYDGTNTEPNAKMSCSLTGVLSGDSTYVSCAASNGTFNSSQVASANLVTATVTISGMSAGNYTLGPAGTTVSSSSATATAYINPAPLSITASSGSITYGGSPFFVGPIYSGFVNGDGPSVLNPQPACLPIFTSTTPAGIYITTCSGAMDPNYTISYVPGSVVVTQATTSTTVASSLNPSNWDNVVTLTATVSDSSTNSTGAPTGTVGFYNVPTGINCATLGVIAAFDTEPLSLTSPYGASTSTPNLPVGTDTILACYNGDPNFFATTTGNGTSTTLAQTVIPAPIVTLAPSGLSFGGQQGGTTSGVQTVTVCNGPSGTSSSSPCYNAPVSTAALAITAIQFTNPNTTSAYFTQTNNCPISPTATLAVGGSCTVSVKFAPPLSAQGIATALLTVTDNNENAPGSTQSSSVVGAGTSAIMSIGSLSTYAIFATANGCSTVNVSGNGTVDSFDGSTNAGNVGTNGNATLSGNPVIDGAVYSPGVGTGNCSSKTMTGLSTSGKAQVTGGLKTLSAPMSYPLPPAPNPAPPTTNQNISGSCGSISGCTPGGSKSVSLAPGQYGNLNVSGGTTVHVKAGTYNVNSLTLSGNSILYLDSWPVVINLAGTSMNSSSPAMDLSGGSMVNPSGITSNLQFYYAGSSSIKLSGGTGSYALVYAPNAAINVSGGSHFYGSIIGSTVNSSGNTAIHYDAALPSINAGDYIWFNSTGLTVKGLPNTGSVKLYVTNASISFTANGTNYNLPVPSAVVTFSSTATSQSTTWDATNNRWSTLIPTSSVNGNATIRTFFDGVAFLVPSDGFPNGIQNVTWQAAYSTSTTGLSFNWQWGAAVYNAFSAAGATGNYTGLNVNPLDSSVPAGTPQAYEPNLVFGDTGAGYTGLYVGTAGVVPTIAPLSVTPSSYDFGTVNHGTPATATIPFVLTNNDTVSYTISSIQMTGTNPGDFVQTNNCPTSPNALAAGASCTFTVTFTPSTSGGTKETAKIVINDNANNSPQTVFLKGTGE